MNKSQNIYSNIVFWLIILGVVYTFFQLDRKSSVSGNSQTNKKAFYSSSCKNFLPTEKAPTSHQKSVIVIPWSKIIKTGAVNDIKVDAKGKLWAATENGVVSVFNDKITYFQQNLGSFPVPQAECLAFGNNKVWIGSLFGLLSIDNHGILHREDIDNKLPSHIIWSLNFSSQVLWIGTQNGLAFIGKNKKIVKLDKSNTHGGLRSLWCQHVRQFGPWLIVAHDKGLSIWNTAFPASNPSIWRNIDSYKARIPLPITDIAYNGANLWLSTHDGVYKLPASFEKIFSGNHTDFISYTTLYGLPSNFVNSLVLIKDSLWIGTDKGLIRMRGGEIKKVQPLHYNGKLKIRAMTSSGDILWVGTNNGLYYLNTAMVN